MKKKARKPIVGGFSLLLKDVRSLQIQEHYPKLIAKLQINLEETGDKKLRSLISECGEDRRLAGLIYVQAKSHLARVQQKWDLQMGEWMITGRAAIAELKKEKKWDGTVYSSDVEKWVFANISESVKLHQELLQATEINETAKMLYASYESRLSALQTYARLVEKRREIALLETDNAFENLSIRSQK